jgi:hypothetical protein
LDFDVAPGGFYVLCVVPGLVPLCVQELHDQFEDWIPDAGYMILRSPNETRLDTLGYSQGGVESADTCETAPTVGDGTAQGETLCRLPDGDDSDNNLLDFESCCATPGAPNRLAVAGQVCATTSLSDLVINEIDYTQPGGDTKEFIELHNRANYRQTGSTSNTYFISLMDSYNVTRWSVKMSVAGQFEPDVPQHGYWLLCVRDSSSFCSGSSFRTVGPASNQLNFDSATNWLPNPNATHPYFTVILTGVNSVLDTMTYGGTHPGVTPGQGVDDIDVTIESRFGVSRFPDSWDTNNNFDNFRTRYALLATIFLATPTTKCSPWFLTLFPLPSIAAASRLARSTSTTT